MEHVPHLLYARLRQGEGHLVLKATYTHNHVGGIKTDGSCPRCLSYAETLADDTDQRDMEIPFHDDNDEETIQIMKTPPQTWYPES